MQENNNNSDDEILHISPEQREKIQSLMEKIAIFEQVKKQHTEDKKAVAEQLGIKVPVLNKRIKMIQKEQEEGGELRSQSNDTEWVKLYLNIKDDNTE